MKANIKLSLFLPILMTIIAIVANLISFEYFNLIFIAGAIYIDIYYLLGYLKREDALVITDIEITVITAFKTRNYLLDDLSNIKFLDGENSIRATYNEKTIILCNNIYSVSLKEIHRFLQRKVNKEAIF